MGWAYTSICVLGGNDMSQTNGGDGSAQSLGAGLWIRLAVVYLLIPAVLLLCGGDLGWWQAWLYTPLIVTAGLAGRGRPRLAASWPAASRPIPAAITLNPK